MPYPGGSSTTSGIRYQNWFLAHQVAKSHFEANRVIYPEAFTDDINIIDDIKIVDGKKTKYFNVKFRSPAKNLHWGIGDLISQNVIKHIKQQFEVDSDAQILFVSESNCYLITEVFQRARNLPNTGDIYKVLESDWCIDLWEKTKEAFGYGDIELYNLATKVSMRSLPLYEIKQLIEHRFASYGNGKSIAKLFFEKSTEYSSYKRRIRKADINRWLMEDGISLNN